MQPPSFPEGSLLDKESQIHHFSTRLFGTAWVHLSQLNRTWWPWGLEQGCELLYSHVEILVTLQASQAGVCRGSWGNRQRLWKWMQVFNQCQLKCSLNFMSCFILQSAYWDPSIIFRNIRKGISFSWLWEDIWLDKRRGCGDSGQLRGYCQGLPLLQLELWPSCMQLCKTNAR